MSMRPETAARTKELVPDPALTVLGATTCEDTALVRSRLSAREVPFVELDVDVDPRAAERLARLHDGALITPTLIVAANSSADTAAILTEPTLEQLDGLLAERDLLLSPPASDVTQFHGATIERAIPIRTLETSRGGTFSVESLRGRRQAALFLAHDAACLACMGYAKQLARQTAALADADAVAIAAIAPTDGLGSFDVWHREIEPDLTILADGAASGSGPSSQCSDTKVKGLRS